MKKKILVKEPIAPPVKLEHFGAYRLGLTMAEIKEYLRRRTRKRNVEKLYKRFQTAAGVNTMASGPQGQVLMYRWDVERFADVVILGKPTYFD